MCHCTCATAVLQMAFNSAGELAGVQLGARCCWSRCAPPLNCFCTRQCIHILCACTSSCASASWPVGCRPQGLKEHTYSWCTCADHRLGARAVLHTHAMMSTIATRLQECQELFAQLQGTLLLAPLNSDLNYAVKLFVQVISNLPARPRGRTVLQHVSCWPRSASAVYLC